MPDPLNMASSGKKGKKSKGKTISLNSFLQDTPGAVNAVPIRKAPSNWADEVEDTYDSYDGGRSMAKTANVVLPTAPKAARGIDDFSHNIPSQPPFNVYLSNLPYDVEEDEIAEFFEELKIVSMRIPREDRPGEGPRVRGFGYVEFEDQESLIEALDKPMCILKGRRIRIEVATNSDDKRRGGRMDMNRDRPEAPTGDWRSFARQEPEGGPPERRFTRDVERSGGMWRDGERPAFGDRDRPTFGDRERPSFRDREDKPITRDVPPSHYESAERRGFGVRRERDERPIERSDRRADDRFDRGGMERNGGGGGLLRRGDDDGRDEPPPQSSRTRPKLNLAPRSVPVNIDASAPVPTSEGATGDKDDKEKPEQPAPRLPAASIFGSAKPVDTTAREREIEQRLAKVEVDSRDDRRKHEGRRRSPERRRYSPRRSSPRGDSLDRRDSSGGRRSPEIRRISPDQRRSPEIRRGSPDRRRGDDRSVRSERRDRNSSVDHERRPPREHAERDMPKIKTPEPLNIVGPNKYAYLTDEGED